MDVRPAFLTLELGPFAYRIFSLVNSGIGDRKSVHTCNYSTITVLDLVPQWESLSHLFRANRFLPPMVPPTQPTFLNDLQPAEAKMCGFCGWRFPTSANLGADHMRDLETLQQRQTSLSLWKRESARSATEARHAFPVAHQAYDCPNVHCPGPRTAAELATCSLVIRP